MAALAQASAPAVRWPDVETRYRDRFLTGDRRYRVSVDVVVADIEIGRLEIELVAGRLESRT
jgi:hypothetical protein